MTKTISPIILTSRPAQKHLDKIRVEHSTLLDSMQNQQMKNEQFTQNEKMEKQIQDTERNTQTLERDTFNQKTSFDNQKMIADNEKSRIEAETRKLAEVNRQKELAIKEQALNTE